MYRKKNDLENLIQSLTNGEKRFITKAFQKSKEGSLHVSLYDKLQKPKSGIINHENEIKGTVLSDNNRFLYKIILKHLKLFNAQLSPDIIIQNHLAEVEILYNHSLSDQAILILLKAKQIAIKNEKFGLYLQILSWEQRLSIVLDQPYRSLDAIRLEEEDILIKNAQINDLLGFYNQIFLIKKQHGFAKGPVKDTLESLILYNPNFPKLEDCQSNKAIYYHNLIFSIYSWMIFDHAKAYEYSKMLLNADSQNILPSDYLTGIFEHITSSVCIAKFTDALHGIQLAQAFMEEYKLNQSDRYRQLFFAYEATYRLIIYSYMGKRTQLAEVITHAENWLETYADVLPIERKQVVIGNIMNAYIAIGNLDKAWIVWNQLFNKQSESVRLDIYADLYLFRIFFYLQTPIYDLVASAAASALRFYRKTEENKSKFQLESSLTQLFTRDVDYNDPKILNPLLHQVRCLLNDYISEVRGTLNFQEHYTRYIIWANAIEKKIPYWQAARDWYKQHSNLRD
ncbi:MAG: hypothetical protein BGO31_10900 [Bacteroidetes bacterium 43-16]|uniref:hypothetical protein n=1 Tax=uncultured Dysgonomonas sp. TaxID=206096 RepID=UPI000928144C|nr:hypothetical protein [uncultured Dysgonomonas sp.]OJV50967.1 MAG: hypothetical protein BGO31_10900 [Bacteroidetes bacterium 43-16]